MLIVMRDLKFFFLFLFIFGFASVVAAEKESAEKLPGSNPVAEEEIPFPEEEENDFWLPDHVTGYRNFVSDSVDSIASGMDSFLAEEQFGDQPGRKARLRWKFGPEIAARGRSDFENSFGLHIPMQGTRRRIGLIVGIFPDEDDDRSVLGDQSDSDFFAGIAAMLRSWEKGDLGWVGGFKFEPEPEFVTGPRLRYLFFETERWRIRGSQFLFWESDDGFGETTRIDFDRRLKPQALLRFRQQATWAEKTSGVEYMSRATYFEALNVRTGWGLEGRISGETEPSWVIDRYRLSLKYRRRTYKKWLFIELEPALDFYREDDYDVSPAIAINFEVIFTRGETKDITPGS